jgi:hypothetical protein
MWSKGSRVLAQQPKDQYWYPATVLSAEGDEVEVHFEDGSADSLDGKQVLPLTLTIGNKVESNFQGGGAYYPGQITKQDGDKVFIHYNDGDEEWTTMSQVRVPASNVRQVAADTGGSPWKMGDRVMAYLETEDYWYPAQVQANKGSNIAVQCEDGATASVSPEQVKRLNIGVGSAVDGRWQGGPTWHPGKVTACDGDRIHIQYNDGDQEWTSIKMIRQAVEHVATTDFDVGSRVLGRWQGGASYYPGRITERNGDKIHIRYDDGDEEWTTLAMVYPIPATVLS